MPRMGVGKQWPTSWTQACFCKLNFIWTQPHLLISVLFTVAVMLWRQTWIDSTKTVWSAPTCPPPKKKLKVFTIWVFIQSLPTPGLEQKQGQILLQKALLSTTDGSNTRREAGHGPDSAVWHQSPGRRCRYICSGSKLFPTKLNIQNSQCHPIWKNTAPNKQHWLKASVLSLIQTLALLPHSSTKIYLLSLRFSFKKEKSRKYYDPSVTMSTAEVTCWEQESWPICGILGKRRRGRHFKLMNLKSKFKISRSH